MTVRWKDKADIGALAAGDRFPVTDISDTSSPTGQPVDKYGTPAEMLNFLATPYIQTLLDDTTEAIARATLGLASTTTDNAIIRANGTTGGTQTSLVTIDDSNNLTLPNTAWLKGRNAANNADLNMFRVNSANYTEWSNPLYFDDESNFADRGALFTVQRNLANPTVVQASLYVLTQGKGDNATQKGVSNAFFQARDRTDVTALNKGCLYGIQVDVHPIVDRNNFPNDDCVPIVISNSGSARGTEAVYIGHNVTGGGRDFAVGFSCECWTSDAVFNGIGTHAYGLDFARNGNAATTFSASAIRLPNNTKISAKNAADNADLELLRLDGSNILQIGGGAASLASAVAGSWTALQTFTTSGSFGQAAIIVSTNADAVAGPVLFLDRASPSPANNDNIGQFGFSGRNASAAFTQYSAFLTTILDTTAGSEDATFNIQTVVAGTLANRVVIGQGMQVGAPAAGDLGSGTVNASGQIQSSNFIKSISATAGVGYNTGAGGAVTQITSRTTGVTLNTICGEITLVSAAGSATYASFTVTNSAMAATDTVEVNQKSGTDLYETHVTAKAAGSFRITFRTTGGTNTEQPVFGFSITKAVAA